jgi:hypothetical protein
MICSAVYRFQVTGLLLSAITAQSDFLAKGVDFGGEVRGQVTSAMRIG